MAGKHRRWMGYLSVSASGPEYRDLNVHPVRGLIPRMAADLRYTTADVDFLETDFQEEHADTAEFEMHRRLRNPTRQHFLDVLAELGEWLSGETSHHDWDGGGIQLCFAGHGRGQDGGLVLADGVVKPDEFAHTLANMVQRPDSQERLRISVVLDSCHSGAFVTALLDKCFTAYADRLVPFHLYAGCMDDEFAWEAPELGHGLFTYCFSVREVGLDAFSAKAIQPDNRFGPSLAVAAGDFGCSLLSMGRQNPVLYWNGAGHIEVARRHQESVPIFEGVNDEYIGLDALRSKLRAVRDRVVQIVRPMQPNRHVVDVRRDEDMRALVHDYQSHPDAITEQTGRDGSSGNPAADWASVPPAP